ncbi:MAG: site-specific DNA-methyltransferase [Bryobacteraceae bacterium]
MATKSTPEKPKTVETLTHEEASRKNIPTAEFQSVMHKDEQTPIRVAYARRNRDLDPQLVWRGKDEQDWSDLVTHAPPLYIQEKVHPKVLIDDLLRRSKADRESDEDQFNLFADFNGLPDTDAKTEFYQHDANWSNRMILGDSLQVMASLAEREGLRGQVQCIYIDPPYGIKFNSNFQWSTTSRDVKDGATDHITREPEQVKAFRDTWRDGLHSYLTYLRDRLTAARDLLAPAGSLFVQIGDENLHRIRALLDEVFGAQNACGVITFRKTSSANSPQARVNVLASVTDYILWYARDLERVKYRQPYIRKEYAGDGGGQYRWIQEEDGTARAMTSGEADVEDLLKRGAKVLRPDTLSSTGYSAALSSAFEFRTRSFELPPNTHWKTTSSGLAALRRADRIIPIGKRLYYKRFIDDFGVFPLTNIWTDVGSSGFSDQRVYVVQTVSRVVERYVLMATDPGDLVLDPTCGSGTTAHVAEQWGRRWITIDTSRVALALARARIMGARYLYYLLADSRDGQLKEAEVTQSVPSESPTHGDIRQGFVYERVPHITLKSIANNAEIDVIWEKFQGTLEPLREQLNSALKQKWEEWEIPREADEKWSAPARKLHAEWWRQRIARQKEIDASIAAKADFEYLYDKPYEDKRKVRVAGPFTVESLSPHRVLAVDDNDELIDSLAASVGGDEQDFVRMILENLKTAGVQQAHKEDKITFLSIAPWPGALVSAEDRYIEGGKESGAEKRAAIFIGPEFGTVSRPDLVAAAREAGDAGFDVLISCAFNYDAHSSEFNKLGRIPVLKARMNADLHMADDLKNTGKGNLFVIFGEPDIEILPVQGGQIQVKVNGVDVFHPNTGEVRSDGADGIACWFIDTDYNEESFFVRHAYFLGANDPYKALKTTLKAEVNEEAWATLNSDTSRPFKKPASGRIAVKVINHLGDEVMKVFKVV